MGIDLHETKPKARRWAQLLPFLLSLLPGYVPIWHPKNNIRHDGWTYFVAKSSAAIAIVLVTLISRPNNRELKGSFKSEAHANIDARPHDTEAASMVR